MILVWLALGCAVIYGLTRLIGKRKPGFFAHCEYWVFLPDVDVPAQEALMKHLLTKYARYFGKNEGLVFSDIRFHMSLVLKEKNPHAFRPDLFDALDVSPDVLRGLAVAKSFVKLRFVSEHELLHRRHLRFLVYLARAIVELGEGTVVYDPIALEIWDSRQFEAKLTDDPEAETGAFHVSVKWTPASEGFSIQSHGHIKVGQLELEGGPFSADQRVIATDLVRAVSDVVWSGTEPTHVRIDSCDDEFDVKFDELKDNVRHVRVLRRQSSV